MIDIYTPAVPHALSAVRFICDHCGAIFTVTDTTRHQAKVSAAQEGWTIHPETLCKTCSQ